MVEGAPLLREYGRNPIEGSNPSFSAKVYAPVAQLDRVSGYEPEGRRFNSFRAHHFYYLFRQDPQYCFFKACGSGNTIVINNDHVIDETDTTQHQTKFKQYSSIMFTENKLTKEEIVALLATDSDLK